MYSLPSIPPPNYKVNNEIKMNKIVCRFHAETGCPDGYLCVFPHVNPGDRLRDSACRHYMKGKCCFGSNCFFDHVSIFEKNGEKMIRIIESHFKERKRHFMGQGAQLDPTMWPPLCGGDRPCPTEEGRSSPARKRPSRRNNDGGLDTRDYSCTPRAVGDVWLLDKEMLVNLTAEAKFSRFDTNSTQWGENAMDKFRTENGDIQPLPGGNGRCLWNSKEQVPQMTASNAESSKNYNSCVLLGASESHNPEEMSVVPLRTTIPVPRDEREAFLFDDCDIALPEHCEPRIPLYMRTSRFYGPNPQAPVSVEQTSEVENAGQDGTESEQSTLPEWLDYNPSETEVRNTSPTWELGWIGYEEGNEN